MTDDELIDSKTASWVGGTTRSLQFYALRHRYEWTLSSKTRHPSAAMKEAWGEELDVVTMLALRPMPILRDWQRFDEEYEIVDLGRNKSKLKGAIYKLKSQARDESNLHDRAKPEVIEDVRKWVKKAAEMREKACKEMSCRASHGVEELFSNALKDDIVAWYSAPVAKNVGNALKKEKNLGKILKKEIDGLQSRGADYDPVPYGDFEDSLRPMLRQISRGPIVTTLKNFLAAFKCEEDARKEITKRRATAAKVAAQLAMLGVSADS